MASGSKAKRQTPRLTPATDRYLELIQACPLRPFRNEADYDRAVAMIDALLDHEPLELDERDYLEMLADLVERWDARRRPAFPATPADVLRHLMEARALTQSEVAAGAGVSQSTVSECLAGKRIFGRSPALKLAKFFGVGVAAFLDDSDV